MPLPRPTRALFCPRGSALQGRRLVGARLSAATVRVRTLACAGQLQAEVGAKQLAGISAASRLLLAISSSAHSFQCLSLLLLPFSSQMMHFPAAGRLVRCLRCFFFISPKPSTRAASSSPLHNSPPSLGVCYYAASLQLAFSATSAPVIISPRIHCLRRRPDPSRLLLLSDAFSFSSSFVRWQPCSLARSPPVSQPAKHDCG